MHRNDDQLRNHGSEVPRDTIRGAKIGRAHPFISAEASLHPATRELFINDYLGDETFTCKYLIISPRASISHLDHSAHVSAPAVGYLAQGNDFNTTFYRTTAFENCISE